MMGEGRGGVDFFKEPGAGGDATPMQTLPDQGGGFQNYPPDPLSAACAAASLAIGTR